MEVCNFFFSSARIEQKIFISINSFYFLKLLRLVQIYLIEAN